MYSARHTIYAQMMTAIIKLSSIIIVEFIKCIVKIIMVCCQVETRPFLGGGLNFFFFLISTHTTFLSCPFFSPTLPTCWRQV